MNAYVLKRVAARRPLHQGGSGLPRMVLSEAETQVSAGPMDAVGHKPIRSHGPFRQRYLIATRAQDGLLSDHAREVIAAAVLLAAADTQIVLALLGPCQDDLAAMGVDVSWSLPQYDAEAWQPEAAVAWLQGCHERIQPQLTLMADEGHDGDWGRRFAVAQGLSTLGQVVELTPAGARQRLSSRFDRLRPHAEIMLLQRGCAEVDLPTLGLNQREVAPAWPQVSVPGCQDLGIVMAEASSVALEEADFIVAAGQGMADIPLFYALAKAWGAATAASRVVVDEGLFTRDRQVGATGKTVVAKVYVAIGISGAVQHLQGIKACRHVIAINTDEAAPIMQRASLAVVHDAVELMQALLLLAQPQEPDHGAD
ncbi:MAG: electron transfer flavoprotein subunit alpha/FixB family protein [Neisseriaceae bacterium]|nr:electron transfer flavoprotein subunit alpha/FixB family protein [Neisseriaceae bacterium]